MSYFDYLKLIALSLLISTVVTGAGTAAFFYVTAP